MPTTNIEDRAFGGDKPYIDLTPARQWGPTIKNHVGASEWATIEEHVAARVGYACELCGASAKTPGRMGKRAFKFKTEMRFAHDETSSIATLKRLLHVCIPCGQAIHLRQTELKSQGMDAKRSPMVGAIARLAFFHGMTEAEIRCWLAKDLAAWKIRHDAGYPANFDVDIVEAGVSRLWA